MLHNLSQKDSLLSQYIAEIRDVEIQADRLRFKRNLERIGEIIATEISKEMEWKDKEVTTPLGISKSRVLAEQPVLGTILRAGLALNQGLQSYFDQADSAFISAYRKHDETGKFEINIEYLASPDITNRILIISDPMLATGASMVLTLEKLMQDMKPKHIHIATAIASTEGIHHVERNLPDATIWAAAIDNELDSNAYIIPGLGDAGDLAYGEKIQD